MGVRFWVMDMSRVSGGKEWRWQRNEQYCASRCSLLARILLVHTGTYFRCANCAAVAIVFIALDSVVPLRAKTGSTYQT